MKRLAWSLIFLIAAVGAAHAQFVYPESGTLTSTYYSPRPYGIHAALDIATAQWKPIGAARHGQVVFRGWSGGYGNLVIIDHGAGYRTYYGHQVAFNCYVGQSVSTGQTIGYVGTTGNSTGPHVHWEIRRWGAKQYMPGSSGQWVTKGTAFPHSYPGLSGSTGSPGPTNGTNSLKCVKVTTSDLNVRTGPGTGYSIKGMVHLNQLYVSHTQSAGWHKVWYDGTDGWIYGGYAAVSSGHTGEKCTASALNVRTGPGTNYAVSGQIHSGQIYIRLGTSGVWAHIYWKGTTRWVHGGYTSSVPF
jgi:uncharacterized protein YraI